MSTILISQLLEKTGHFDKDERYMATSDLCNELQKELKIDAILERRICTSVLKLLDDNSNDVQSIAVKCLGILVTKVQEPQVGDICDKLCGLILEGKSELRDIYSIGLKTLIEDVPRSMGSSIASRLGNRLLGGITKEGAQETRLECLDILTDLLKRFGHDVMSEHEDIMNIALEQLSDTRHVVRKRATACIGALGVVLSDALLNRLLEHLLNQIKSPRYGQDVRTLIQTIGTLSRAVGYRLGKHLDSIIPLFLKFCGESEDEALQTEQANELRENCLQGFESFVLRCPREISTHLTDIIRVGMTFMKHDPNYSYGNPDDEDEENDMDEDEFSDVDEDYSDDDDTSWKVRRASVRLLTAVVNSRPELLGELYAQCSEEIIDRFKEREESVRLDVLQCFSEMIRVTVVADNRLISDSKIGNGMKVLMQPPRLTRQRSCITMLHCRIPSIIQASNKLLGPKGSVKTKCAVFGMLRQLVEVVPGGLSEHIQTVIPHVLRALDDRNSSLKLDALVFLRMLMETHKSNCFHSHIPAIVPYAVQCTKEEWYRIIAESLRLIGTIVLAMRQEDSSEMSDEPSCDFSSHILPLYNAVVPRLSAYDIDQEIKECAITSMGYLISIVGDKLESKLAEVLPLLMERLQNEITRVATLKALAMIAQSPLKLDLSSVLEKSIVVLSQFLRQQSRPLKQSTLDTLNALVTSNGSNMSEKMCTMIVDESASLVSDLDLHLSNLSLRLVVSVLEVTSVVAETVRTKVLPNALILTCSPLLQGYALQALMNFFRQLVVMNLEGIDFDILLGSLTQPATEGVDIPKQAIMNIARCVAILCVSSTADNQMKTVEKFLSDIQTTKLDVYRHLALLCVGEIGRNKDLSGFTKVQEVILKCFLTDGEETKAAAAYALGHVCVGNIGKYLPLILSELKNDKNLYLLLSSLKEVISCFCNEGGAIFQPHIQSILPILLDHCENPEEGVRNMVAECLGRLAILDSNTIIPTLAELCTPSTSLLKRWTSVTSLKYCVTSQELLVAVSNHMTSFLSTLKDEDITVRRAALLTLNSASHHQPRLIQDHMSSIILPALQESMELKLERVVDLGPFKHKVDDGLVIRKAAYACMDTLIDTLPERSDISSFLPYLKLGLADHDDVQMLCHEILVKICAIQSGAIISALDILLEPLDKTIHRKVKDSQVGTEVDRANDSIRSALRAVDSINCIPEVSKYRKFQDLMERITKKDKLLHMLEAIRSEHGDIHPKDRIY